MTDIIQDVEYSTEIIAHVFGVTKSRIRQLSKEGMPKAGRNRYPLIACVQWYIGFWKNKADYSDTVINKHQRRLVQAKADKAEMEVKVMRGELVHANQVKNDALKIGTMVRTSLEGIGNKVAPILADMNTAPEVASVINKEVNAILRKLADEIQRL